MKHIDAPVVADPCGGSCGAALIVHSLAPKVREQLSRAVTAAQSVAVKGGSWRAESFVSDSPQLPPVWVWAAYRMRPRSAADLVVLSVQCAPVPRPCACICRFLYDLGPVRQQLYTQQPPTMGLLCPGQSLIVPPF